MAPSSAPGRGMGAAGGVAGFRRMDARTESGYVSENAESPPPLFAFPPQGPPGSPWVAVRGGCLLLGTRRSALPSFIFGSQGPRPSMRFLHCRSRSRKFNRASRSENFFRATLPQSFPQNFPDLRFRGFKGLALGSGETPLGLRGGGGHDFPVSTEYYTIYFATCAEDGNKKKGQNRNV